MFGKRKFTIALMSLIMSFVLALMGLLSAEGWWKVVTAIVGLYGATNAASAFANRGK